MKMLEELEKESLNEIGGEILTEDNHTVFECETDTLTGLTQISHCIASFEDYQNGYHDIINSYSIDMFNDMSDLNKIFDCNKQYSVLVVNTVGYVYDNNKHELIGWC